MAVNAAKVVVGLGGTVMYGTVGVTSPASATAATTGYTDVGYLDEDGVTIAASPEVTDFNVWQSKQPVRRENQTQDIRISGNLAEWNAAVVPLVFGGGAVAAGSYNFPSDTAALNEFSPLVDVQDGTKLLRFVFYRATQAEAVETQFNRSNLATLSFNFGVLAPTAGGSPGVIHSVSTAGTLIA